MKIYKTAFYPKEDAPDDYFVAGLFENDGLLELSVNAVDDVADDLNKYGMTDIVADYHFPSHRVVCGDGRSRGFSRLWIIQGRIVGVSLDEASPGVLLWSFSRSSLKKGAVALKDTFRGFDGEKAFGIYIEQFSIRQLKKRWKIEREREAERT